MKLPFRLRRTQERRPVRALFLPGDGRDVLVVCARLRLERFPKVYQVDGGFLLRAAPTGLVPGVVHLGELAPNLYLLADADLVPGLTDDEAAALCRTRGLVFLPDRVLEFDPQKPLDPACFLMRPLLKRSNWRPLPAVSPLPERIELVVVGPEPTPEAVIEAGGASIGEGEPGRQSLSLARKIVGQGAQGLGRGLAWLGRLVHLRALARLGAKLAAAGAGLAAQLREKQLGNPRARLQELLDRFRAGDVEQALRQAVPLSEEPGSPERLGGIELPTHDTRYSLANILRGGKRGGSAWLAPEDLFRALQEEYRRQAQAAIRRGDYRRAAFIYGKLLGDYRQAAAALAQGGLHRDAAILYRDRLNSPAAAAREFEAAGDYDRALEIYRSLGEHLRAGDLLRALGEEEQALAEYGAAADRLVAARRFLEAGEMLHRKTGRPDLARRYFEAGWAGRPGADFLPCIRRLLELDADDHDLASLSRRVEQAEEYFADARRDGSAGDYYNHLAALARRPGLAVLEEDLRDRALGGLARILRRGVEEGRAGPPLVSMLFGAGTTWEVPVVGDAQTAAVAVVPMRRADADPEVVRVRAAIPIVTAVDRAAGSQEIFLGFQSGEIVCLNAVRGETRPVEPRSGPIVGLAAHGTGDLLAVLFGAEEQAISFHLREFDFRAAERRPVGPGSNRVLASPLAFDHISWTFLADGYRGVITVLRGPRLLEEREIRLPAMPRFAHVPFPDQKTCGLILFDGDSLFWFPQAPEDSGWVGISCPISGAIVSPLRHPVPSFLGRGPNRLEMVGLGTTGSLVWLDLELVGEGKPRIESRQRSVPGSYLAAAMTRAGRIAAVDAENLTWLQVGAYGFAVQAVRPHALPDPVACFSLYPSGQVVVVCGDGTVARFHPPKG